MGFPMTVERVIARNRIENPAIKDDIRRLAEDAVTLERARIAERVRQVDWLYVDYWKIESAVLAIIEEKP